SSPEERLNGRPSLLLERRDQPVVQVEPLGIGLLQELAHLLAALATVSVVARPGSTAPGAGSLGRLVVCQDSSAQDTKRTHQKRHSRRLATHLPPLECSRTPTTSRPGRVPRSTAWPLRVALSQMRFGRAASGAPHAAGPLSARPGVLSGWLVATSARPWPRRSSSRPPSSPGAARLR